MRNYRFLAVLLLLSGTSPLEADEGAQDALRVTLEEATQRVGSSNLEVLDGALLVYEARERIRAARGELLPSLRVWSLVDAGAGIVAGIFGGAWAEAAGAAASLVGEVAPFLVPANWFRLKESKILARAERQGYEALWANEVHQTRILFLEILRDQTLAEALRDEEASLSETYRLVRVREEFGGLPTGTAKALMARILSLSQDQRALAELIAEESHELARSVGIEAGREIALAPVAMDEPDNDFPSSEMELLVARALEAAPELRELDALLEVLPWIRKEIRWTFLGASGEAREASGGFFSSIPLTSGLGFSTAPALRIARHEETRIRLARLGTEDTLERNVRLVAKSLANDLRSSEELREEVRLTTEVVGHLRTRLRFGERVESADIIEASRARLQSSLALLGILNRHGIRKERMARLLRIGVYEGPAPEPSLESEPAALPLPTTGLAFSGVVEEVMRIEGALRAMRERWLEGRVPAFQDLEAYLRAIENLSEAVTSSRKPARHWRALVRTWAKEKGSRSIAQACAAHFLALSERERLLEFCAGEVWACPSRWRDYARWLETLGSSLRRKERGLLSGTTECLAAFPIEKEIE